MAAVSGDICKIKIDILPDIFYLKCSHSYSVLNFHNHEMLFSLLIDALHSPAKGFIIS